MELIAITPKRPIINVSAVHQGLTQEMLRFILDMKLKIKTYPPDRPTQTGYRRTEALGRSWSHSLEARPGLIIGKVMSDPTVMMRTPHTRRLKSGKMSKPWFPKKSYAPHVVGKKQTSLMASRGWKKVGDILKKEWPGQVRKFQQVVNRSK